jgi:hypothetical protein
MIEEERRNSTSKKPALPPLFKKNHMNLSDIGRFDKK